MQRLTGRCAICGERIQRNTGKWRHASTAPDGSPNDHKPKLIPKRRGR